MSEAYISTVWRRGLLLFFSFLCVTARNKRRVRRPGAKRNYQRGLKELSIGRGLGVSDLAPTAFRSVSRLQSLVNNATLDRDHPPRSGRPRHQSAPHCITFSEILPLGTEPPHDFYVSAYHLPAIAATHMFRSANEPLLVSIHASFKRSDFILLVIQFSYCRSFVTKIASISNCYFTHSDRHIQNDSKQNERKVSINLAGALIYLV